MLLHHRYQIIRDLAEGSFGKTFLAEDTQMPTRQRCVIKQLKPINDDRPDVVQLIQERFAREAAVLEAVGRGHSQIPSLLAYFETEGQFYLVQEWIEGVPLSDLVQTPWPEEKVAALLASALEALAHIHAQNLIHRDIKPDNIILRQSDQCPCLIDFGAVKELMNTVVVSSESQSSSVVIGTLGFMAPEQAVGRPVFSSDLYSLAMTAIFLLTARSPLEIPTDSMNGRLLWNQFAPDVNPRLAGILTRAIHPYPPTRFASATDMLAVLTAPSSSPVGPPVRATAEHTPSSPPQSPSPAIGTEISLSVSPAAQNSPATFIGSAKTAIGLPALSTTPPLATSEAVRDSLAQDPVQSSVGGVPSGSSVPKSKSGNKLKNGYYNTTPSREQQKENRTFLLKVGGIVLGSLLLVAALGGGYVALSGRLSVGEIDASSPESLEKAIAALEKKVEARPDNVVAQLGLIEGYVNRGEYDDALSQIDTLTQNSADDLETTAQALYWKGLVQTIQGDYAEAIATLTDSVAQDGNHIESIILLGTVYGGTGQYDTAIEHFQKAIALDPSYSTAYVRQAPTEELRGETETVEDLLSTAQPLLSTGQEIDFYSYRGNFYFGLGDLEKAEAAWEKTDTFSPEDANDYAAQGFSQGLLGNTSEAMDSFEQSLAINPNALNAYLFRASIHFRQEDFDKAAADVESALAINPRSMFAHQLNGNILVSRAEPDLPAAISAVTKALNTDPNNPLVLRDRCAVHYLTNQFDNAIADCTQSLNTNPHNADVYALRGQSYFSQANHERADEDLSRAIELNESSGKQPTAFVYGARAVSRDELGDNAGAQADATKAIALDPKEPDYYKLRGMLRFIAEDQKGAGEDLKKAQELYRAKGEEDAELNTILDSLEQLGIL